MPFLIAALLAVVLAAAALAAASVADWKSAAPAAVASPQGGAAELRARGTCATCGRVQSVRRLAARGGAPATYEITVRLRDGSTHVHTDATPANWRRGESVVFIAGERRRGG